MDDGLISTATTSGLADRHRGRQAGDDVAPRQVAVQQHLDQRPGAAGITPTMRARFGEVADARSASR